VRLTKVAVYDRASSFVSLLQNFRKLLICDCRGGCPEFASLHMDQALGCARKKSPAALEKTALKKASHCWASAREMKSLSFTSSSRAKFHFRGNFSFILLRGYFAANTQRGRHTLKQPLGDVKMAVEILKDVQLAFMYTGRTSKKFRRSISVSTSAFTCILNASACRARQPTFSRLLIVRGAPRAAG
jgi:hypothetical protein